MDDDADLPGAFRRIRHDRWKLIDEFGIERASLRFAEGVTLTEDYPALRNGIFSQFHAYRFPGARKNRRANAS
jgi:hypothetical protein